MRKFTLLFTMLALSMGFSMARADVVSPYTYNFEGLSTSSTDFAPAGWGHVVEGYDGYGDFYYVDYQLKESGGYGDNGAYLYIGSQTIGDGEWDQGTVADMLVTPPITGDASIYVKKNKPSGTITFYTCSYNASTKKYSKGSKYDVTVPELSETEWTKVDIPGVAADTRIGICGDDVSIDEFAAASAVIELRKELQVSLVKLLSGATADADAAGNITLKMNVKVKNNGDIALNPGDENYSLSIMRKNTGSAADTEVYTQPIAVALQPGETSDFIELNAVIPVTESARSRFDVRENITGSSSYGGWVDIYAYKPDFSVTTTSFDVISNGTLQDFGISQSSVDKEYNIRNTKGAAPLAINSITVPEGFTYSIKDEDVAETLTTPFVVRAHEKLLLTVTMDASVLGSRSGDIVVTPADGQGTAITLPVSGTIVDPSKLYVTFADGKFPAGTYVEGNSWTVDKYTNGDGNYSAVNSSVTPMTKFVLPKIRLGEGESLTFTAAKRGSSSKLNVYYSADRVNWTLAQSISEDASDEANKFSADKYGSSYSYIDVFKYKSFTPAIPAGDWYVAFEAGYSRIGSIVGGTVLAIPEHELLVSNVVMPEEGVVNHAYTASATIANVGTADITEGELTAKLYFGETAMQMQALPALASGASTSVSFNVPLREAGTFATKIAVEGTATAEVSASLVVAQEAPSGSKQVGTVTTTGTYVPVRLNYRNSDSEIIYTQDVIGLAEGTAIKGLTFKGYKSSKELPLSLEVWMENTTDGAPDASAPHSTEGMTKVYSNPNIVLGSIGDSKNHMPIFDLDFSSTPFVYTGGNLRIIVQSRSTTYISTNFEVDGNRKNMAIYRSSDSPLDEEDTYRTADLPVVYLHIDKEATSLSGTVTANGAPVADAEVKIASGIVEYSGTTDADGKYTFPVYQDNLEYTMTVTKDGYFEKTETVAFNGESIVKDVALESAEGFKILSFNIPETGEVNTAYTATVKLLNGIAKEAGSYTAHLFVNDGILAGAEAVAIGKNAEQEFTFSYMPREAGTVSVYAKFTYASGYVQTEAVNVTIAEEKADAEVIVGEANSTDRAGAITPFNKNSRTEIIYPKSLINLPAGTKLDAIRFYGSHYAKDFKITLNAWVGNVAEGTALQGFGVDGLTQVATDQIIDMNKTIEDTAMEPIVELTFPDGFVYDGGDVRLYLDASATGWVSTLFEVDKNVSGQAQQAASDSELTDSSQKSNISLPVAHFVVSPYKTLSGAVKNEKGEAVASAYIILASADGVEYYSETDAEGAFSMDVIKYGKEYTLTVSHPSYDAYTHPETISLADGNISGLAITLTKTYTFSGVVTDAETHAPIAGVEIYVSNPESGADVMTGTTDENGAFDLKFKQLGTYDILFKAAGYDMVSYEGTPFEGDMVGTAVEMQKTVYTFSGVVTDAETKAPIKGVEVYVSDPESGADVMTGTTDENGVFALKFKQLGTYNVLFKAAGYDMVSSEEVPFEGNFDITVEMQKTVRTFSGTVTDAESHAAIAGASVALYKGENKVAEATTGADGSFEIKVKDLAVYSLVVKAEGYDDFTFDTIDLTEGDMTDTPIEMTPNSGVGMLTADGIRVYGTVGAVVVESATEATVRVYNAAGSLVRRADVAGKTRIEGLQRGVYIVNGVKVIVK